MCLESGTQCAAAHVNYHHRPEADEEEAYVRSFCAERDIPLYVKNEPFSYTGNFEAAARTYRYDFFARLVREHGFAGMMTAHHEDDLIETYFMQEEKNIEPAYYGLKEEILYKGVLLRRPLLSYTKKQLEEYCLNHGIRYYTDATNADETYTRNRIRHTMVEPMNRFERDMVLREIRQKNAVRQERVCRVKTYVRDEKTSLKDYRCLREADRLALLRIVLRNDHAGRAYLTETDHILMTKNDFVIPVKDQILVQQDGYFFLHAKVCPYADTYMSPEELMNAVKPYYRIEPGIPGVNALTLREDDFPLTVRSFEEGDRIRMRFGTKSVHRFFIDRHIPRWLRSVWPVAVNASGEIILVPGLGCDVNHYSVTPDIVVIQCHS